MRKTKIVCTIGPACNTEEILSEMCLAGMNVARLNFSHGTHEDHKINIDRIKKVREKLGLPIAILLDTKGPEYRIKTFADGKIELKAGDSFIFTSEDVIGDQNRVSVNYEALPDERESPSASPSSLRCEPEYRTLRIPTAWPAPTRGAAVLYPPFE